MKRLLTLLNHGIIIELCRINYKIGDLSVPIKRISSIFFSVIILIFSSSAAVFSADSDLVKFEKAKEEFRRGVVFFNNMQYLAAVEFFRKAVSSYPDYYSARDYLARSYKLAGFTDASILEYKKAAGIYPENISIKNKIDYLNFKKSGMSGFSSNRYLLKETLRSGNMQRFGFPNAMDFAMDSENNLYITSFSSSKLVKVDIQGKGTDIFRPNFSGGLYGIDILNKRVIVSDFKSDMIILMTTDGSVLKKIGQSGNGDGSFHGPEGVCFDSKGNIYVVDSGNYRIQKFDSSGKHILSFGKRGDYEGEFKNPSDLAVLNDKLYVTDTAKGIIAVFDLWGNYIKDVKNKMVISPRGIVVRGKYLLLSDEKGGVFYLNPDDGETIDLVSQNEKMTSLRPVSSVMGGDGYLYVLDSALNRIYTLSPVEKQYTNLELDITSVDTAKFPTVALYMNVRNRNGDPIYGLKSENFSITEDNSKIQRLYSTYLKDRFTSASFVMLVDRTESMSGRHNDIPWAADFILKKMRKNDSVMVMNFNSRVWAGSNYDWSRRRTLSALKKRDYSSGNIMGDALYQSVSKMINRMNRRSLFMITSGRTGENSFSKYSPDIIIDYAREHFVQINIVTFSEPDPELKRIAENTGGSIIRVAEVDKLRSVYDSVRSFPEYRYVIVFDTYKKAPFKGWWTDLKIQVDYKGQKGIEWGGYFVP